MWQGIKNIYHLVVALLANVYFGFPSRNLTVIGVTGTDGKTTTVSLIYHILKTAGLNASMISSVGAVISGKEYKTGFHVTTPSSWKLQGFIKNATETIRYTLYAKHYLVLEVTSHALDQYRVWGIDFEVGVLTNVTHEHLDYHKTYENYVKTKTKLLKMAKGAVVNRDDESYKILNSKYQIANIHSKNKKWITYGITRNADINPQTFLFKTKLLGEFNRYNVLAAIAACKTVGVKDEDIRKGIESFEAPVGRMEVVYEDEFTVMIDFAHTPNAIENVLSTVKPKVKGRLIHVFGSAGERDFKKRPEMGRISAKYADVIVLTAEDPRSESVEKIMEEIAAGIKKLEVRPARYASASVAGGSGKLEVLRIVDRQEAINAAIKMAKKGDLVLITGKGHEKSMNYGRGEEPWSEHEAVRRALKGIRA